MFRLLFLIWFYIHPVHVTVTSIDYVPEESAFKGFLRIFMDDYLLDCEHHGYRLSQDELIAGTKPAIESLEKYLNEKIELQINDKVILCSIEGMKITNNEMDINIVFSGVANPEKIGLKNRIMTDLYPDQANMMIVKVADFEEGIKLTSLDVEKIFILNSDRE